MRERGFFFWWLVFTQYVGKRVKGMDGMRGNDANGGNVTIPLLLGNSLAARRFLRSFAAAHQAWPA